ncbi:MAG: transcriptional regulator [Candidatus Omnitrophica bacterium]|nr:transcriptional regulator [Candidatus Omnitrophota bacterium]
MKQFMKNPVFTVEEFKSFLAKRGTTGARSAESLLAYYLKAGHVIRVKRGLYAVVPAGSDAKRYVPDPFLVAAKMAPDAVLCHHTALEWHGKAYSVFNHFTYQTTTSANGLSYNGWTFRPVKLPVPLQKKGNPDFGVLTAERHGMDVRVASLERTLVDVLDRPVYSGSWEEIWRSLESIEFFDLDQVVEYVCLLGKSLTAARVGFFLEQHRDALMAEEKHFKKIEELRPKQPSYFDWRTKSGKLNKEWNLIVPEEVLNKTWEEIL